MKRKMMIGFIVATVAISSCKKEKPSEPTIPKSNCPTSTSDFQSVYSLLANAQDYDDVFSIDLFHHEYEFTLNTNENLCKIGYQSTNDTITYVMKITNEDAGTVVYENDHTFDSAQTEYISVSGVSLNQGVRYKISRKVKYGYDQGLMAHDLIGRCAYSSGWVQNSPFPLIYGSVTIIKGGFYDDDPSGNTIGDYSFPYIDLIFQQ